MGKSALSLSSSFFGLIIQGLLIKDAKEELEYIYVNFELMIQNYVISISNAFVMQIQRIFTASPHQALVDHRTIWRARYCPRCHHFPSTLEVGTSRPATIEVYQRFQTYFSPGEQTIGKSYHLLLPPSLQWRLWRLHGMAVKVG